VLTALGAHAAGFCSGSAMLTVSSILNFCDNLYNFAGF